MERDSIMNGFINATIGRFRRSAIISDRRGLSTVEYVIILLLIAVFAIATWTKFGTTIRGKIEEANTRMGEMDEADTAP